MEFQQLKTGEQDVFDMKVIVHPIKTMEALCYKIEFLKLKNHCTGLYLTLSSPTNLGVDKLEGIDWYVAANNTWQGIITGRWPYDNIPTKFSGKLKEDMDYNEIRLKEHEWKYIKGSTLPFEKCFDEIAGHDDFEDQNCHSIFDPNSIKYEKRYFNLIYELNHKLLQNCYF